MNRAKIIACGNLDRGDAAAGLLVARKLQELGFQVEQYCGEAFAMIDLWQDADHCVLIDSVLTGAEAGEIFRWDANNQRLSRHVFRCSTRSFGIADAVELARMLGRLPRRLTVYGIEAGQVETGAPPCRAVLDSICRLAECIAVEVGRTPVFNN